MAAFVAADLADVYDSSNEIFLCLIYFSSNVKDDVIYVILYNVFENNDK